MTNVLQLINGFHQGGTERQTLQLTRLLHESGRYRVHLACGDPAGPLRADAEQLGLGEIPSFPLTSLYDHNFVVQVRRFARHLREHRIDVVHTHDFYTNIFGMFGAALARVPVRIASRRETEGIRSPAQRFVERRAYALAHTVVTNAEAIREQLIREGLKPGKVVTTYNGLDVARLGAAFDQERGAALAALDLPRGERRCFVTIIANMFHPMKDQATFLRAARLVREAVPEAAFVLAGEGELMEPLRALAAELGLEHDAFFLGRCTQVGALLSVSEVCVLSSKGVEGLSNSILEYMAAARPVVTTDVGGAREAVIDGETGYVVPASDERAMANRIIELLRNPAQAQAMGARGRELVGRKFSCEARLERTAELYDRLLARRPVSARRGVGRGVIQGDV